WEACQVAAEETGDPHSRMQYRENKSMVADYKKAFGTLRIYLAPLKTLCGPKDHHVMGEDPNEAFLLLRTPGTCAQGGAQEPLVTADDALDLGALTVDALGE